MCYFVIILEAKPDHKRPRAIQYTFHFDTKEQIEKHKKKWGNKWKRDREIPKSTNIWNSNFSNEFYDYAYMDMDPLSHTIHECPCSKNEN